MRVTERGVIPDRGIESFKSRVSPQLGRAAIRPKRQFPRWPAGAPVTGFASGDAVPTIYRANSDRLSVADAKRLILDAVPREPAADIYASVDEQGNIDFDGPIECRVNESANIHASFIDRDFVATCEDLSIRPRHKYRPVFTDYTGDVLRDDTYTIAHDEFVRLAELFGVLVAIGDAPEPGPVVAASASGKRWTPEHLDELRRYRTQHGTKKAAAHFGISEARVRGLLPSEKPKATPFEGLIHRMR